MKLLLRFCLFRTEVRAAPALKRTEREAVDFIICSAQGVLSRTGVSPEIIQGEGKKFMVSVIAHIGFYAAIVLGLKAVFEKLTSLF